ncbi:MAG: histidine phosphatase family protein [Hyphomicrobiaceae bacterium]|nr:histidine phosphatase family protein [Hyphomicrobiaceae bacterium]
MRGWRWGVAVAVMIASFVSGDAFAQSRLQDNELGKALVRGGYAILMRHAPADQDKADTDPLNFANTRAQQPLTEQGRAGAKAFGESMRAMGVTFSEVMASRFQRALQTAILAGYKGVKGNIALTEGSLVVSPNENRRRAAMLRQLMVQPLAPGQNRLMISHRANIAQAFGKEWFDVKEGEASIFQIEKGTYTLIARLQLDEWTRIAAAFRR